MKQTFVLLPSFFCIFWQTSSKRIIEPKHTQTPPVVGTATWRTVCAEAPVPTPPHQEFHPRGALAWPWAAGGAQSCAHLSLTQQIRGPKWGGVQGHSWSKGKVRWKENALEKAPKHSTHIDFYLITSKMTFFLGHFGIVSLKLWQNCHLLLFPD